MYLQHIEKLSCIFDKFLRPVFRRLDCQFSMPRDAEIDSDN